MVDGVLLVVHSGKISRKVINRARKLLQDVVDARGTSHAPERTGPVRYRERLGGLLKYYECEAA